MTDATTILVPGSIGELCDKITILQLKSDRIADPEKLTFIRHELQLLERTLSDALGSLVLPADLMSNLAAVNAALWDVEDALREHESAQDFGALFIELARSVYKTNDRRADLKRAINIWFGSGIIEQKSYGAR